MPTLIRTTAAVKRKDHEHLSFNGQKTKSLEFVIRKNGTVLEIWETLPNPRLIVTFQSSTKISFPNRLKK